MLNKLRFEWTTSSQATSSKEFCIFNDISLESVPKDVIDNKKRQFINWTNVDKSMTRQWVRICETSTRKADRNNTENIYV